MSGNGSPLSENRNRSAIRVVVADDHPLFRACEVEIFRGADHIEVVGEAGTGLEAVSLTRALQPDVLVINLALPVENGLETIASVHCMGLLTRILLLTVSEDIKILLEVFQRGAYGCVIKTANAEELVVAVRRVVAGEIVIPSLLLSMIWSTMSRAASVNTPLTHSLTAQEIEILRQIKTGASNRDIAENLHISVYAVQHCIHSIFGKLHVSSRAQAAVYALREEQHESPDMDHG